MIYLNNAATSYPKPPSVVEAVTAALAQPPVSSLRSNVSAQDDVLTQLRQSLGRLFHIADWERIFFCSSATDALNRLLGGRSWKECEYDEGSHNSVLRPLANHVLVSEDAESGIVICNHCSNVTGEIVDVQQECQKAHAEGKLFLLDVAQSAGCIPVDVDGWDVDLLAFTGHKSLLGPMGTGGYYVRRGIDLRPTQFGGTGRDSSTITYTDGDWEYEVGTQNMPGLAGLKAGVDYVLQRGVENIFQQEQQLTQWLIQALQNLPKVQLYIPSTLHSQGPVVSFNIDGLRPSDVGYILQNSYGITVRTGLHCSPLIHRKLGTEPYGTIRVSLSDFTTQQDLQALVDAVHEIAHSF